MAKDLVALQPDVIVVGTTSGLAAVAQETRTIPIVFVSGVDPVQMGLVSSFHRPDGNVTGFYFPVTELPAKRLALLHELVPGAKRIAMLVNSASATAEPTVREVAAAFGIQPRAVRPPAITPETTPASRPTTIQPTNVRSIGGVWHAIRRVARNSSRVSPQPDEEAPQMWLYDARGGVSLNRAAVRLPLERRA